MKKTKTKNKDGLKNQGENKKGKRLTPVTDDALTEVIGGAVYAGVWD